MVDASACDGTVRPQEAHTCVRAARSQSSAPGFRMRSAHTETEPRADIATLYPASTVYMVFPLTVCILVERFRTAFLDPALNRVVLPYWTRQLIKQGKM